MDDLRKQAFELFSEVHRRLGHDKGILSVDHFERPEVRGAWTEIARLAIGGIDVCDRCDMRFIAYKLFVATHAALNDGVDTSLAEFAWRTRRYEAWVEIAKVLTERERRLKKLATHPSLHEV